MTTNFCQEPAYSKITKSVQLGFNSCWQWLRESKLLFQAEQLRGSRECRVQEEQNYDKGRVIWNEARRNRGNSDCWTTKVFWTMLQILFYFQKAKKHHWVGRGFKWGAGGWSYLICLVKIPLWNTVNEFGGNLGTCNETIRRFLSTSKSMVV